MSISNCDRARLQAEDGRRTFVYAFWGFHASSTRWVRETYSTRFAIATTYPQMNEARIRTCTPSPLFFVGLAMSVRNVWVTQ
ncbi:MAG: hypothetical protein HQ567_33325 [Candidatus Nealsonbacteria bacterium]|nr:hypothetical protein [Candidatus Nealsonbacteria bacterium]